MTTNPRDTSNQGGQTNGALKGESGDSLNTATTLIARRDALRPEVGRLAPTTTPTAATTATISDGNADWLDDRDLTVDAVVTMERIRTDHFSTYKRLMAFADTYAGLRILHGLVEYRQGVGYDRLTEYTGGSKRSARRKVKTLVDLDVVERRGNPTTVTFTDLKREYLAVDAAAMSIETE